jgi:hypothetical protein
MLDSKVLNQAFILCARQASLRNQISQISQSSDAVLSRLKAEKARLDMEVNNFYAAHGPVSTAAGSIKKSKSNTTNVYDESLMLSFAQTVFPDAVKTSVSVSALLEAGCKWSKGVLVTSDGTEVPGVGLETTDTSKFSAMKEWDPTAFNDEEY